ncbi:MAG: ferritin [bacterium]
MLSERVQDALNKQLNAELYSSYLYLSMSAYFHSVNLPGFANWMRVQAQEELVHAMKFYDYVNEHGGRVTLGQVEAPPKDWDSAMDAFEHVYEHEKKVTGLINNLVDLVTTERDGATNNFLRWFVSEQAEEESSASDVLGKVKLMSKRADGLSMVDRELGQRVFGLPAASEGG